MYIIKFTINVWTEFNLDLCLYIDYEANVSVRNEMHVTQWLIHHSCVETSLENDVQTVNLRMLRYSALGLLYTDLSKWWMDTGPAH